VSLSQETPWTRRRVAKNSAAAEPVRTDLIDRYEAGATVTQIAIASGSAFSEVYSAVRKAHPGERIRI